MKILEWNINKRTKNDITPQFVVERILGQKAHVICLVEYTDDQSFKDKLQECYWVKESIPKSGNQILIAISKSFSIDEPEVICAREESTCYNFMHIKCKDFKNRKISIIGIRMLTGKGRNQMDASVQTPPLVKYLKLVPEPFICIGDYNIQKCRMSIWFKDYHVQTVKTSGNVIDQASYFFPSKGAKRQIGCRGGMGILDHALVRSTDDVTAEYCWDYIADDEVYPDKEQIIEGCDWDIKPNYPDHAMMICDWSPFPVRV